MNNKMWSAVNENIQKVNRISYRTVAWLLIVL